MWHGVLALLLVLPISLLISFDGGCAEDIAEDAPPFSITDDRGRSIRLDHFAKRIVSLSPHITELIFAAGAGNKLVGADRYSDYPEAAKWIPSIGDSSSLDLERILALKPDLVIAWRSGNSIQDIEKLEKLGLTVFAAEATTLEDVSRSLRMMGKLTGMSSRAEPAARAYEEDLRQITRRDGARRQIRVFQLIWHQPLMTVNGNHIMSDIINICGGINVFASAPALTPVISAENLLEADPQAIISNISQNGAADRLRRLSHISAVRNEHWFFVHPDLMHRPTPRMLQAVKSVCAKLEKVRSSEEKKVVVPQTSIHESFR